MSNIKKHITSFIVVLLALQILNLSTQARPLDEVLLVNSSSDMNRIDHAVEYIMEILMDQKDFFPEQKDQQNNHPIHFHKTIEFKLFPSSCISFLPAVQRKAVKIPISFKEDYSYQFCTEINPPPPKA